MGTLADVHSKDHFTYYTKYMGSADTSRILPKKNDSSQQVWNISEDDLGSVQ